MRIGIVGVSGYGGSELLRLCVQHPSFEVVYVAGESSAGQALAQRFPTLAGRPAGKLKIEPFVPESITGMGLLFASLPTGKSREPLARVSQGIKPEDRGMKPCPWKTKNRGNLKHSLERLDGRST